MTGLMLENQAGKARARERERKRANGNEGEEERGRSKEVREERRGPGKLHCEVPLMAM